MSHFSALRHCLSCCFWLCFFVVALAAGAPEGASKGQGAPPSFCLWVFETEGSAVKSPGTLVTSRASARLCSQIGWHSMGARCVASAPRVASARCVANACVASEFASGRRVGNACVASACASARCVASAHLVASAQCATSARNGELQADDDELNTNPPTPCQ